MRPAALLLPLLLALPLHATVTVKYGDPTRFTDAGDLNTDPVNVMKSFADQLKTLGDRHLAPGTHLDIEILDLDRAGRTAHQLPNDLRMMNGKKDMPCIDLRYTLTPGGTAPGQSKRERVCDSDFLRTLEGQYSSQDPLVYETRMLDEWFRKRFGITPAARISRTASETFPRDRTSP